MEKLLQWSIANANGDQETARRVGAPDPKALAELFGAAGPDEPTLMIQAMQVINHPEATLESKEIAFDNFEMLVENLDNANNIENLKLWQPILEQLDADKDEVLQRYACSVIGTAVQNNEKSQKDLLKYDNALEKIINIAKNTETSSQQLRLKALYALSNQIRHNADAYAVFEKFGGWELIQVLAKETDNERIQLRVNSLLTSIISSGLSDEKKRKIESIFPKERSNEILLSYQ